VRAELRAYPAMAAYQRPAPILVKTYGAYSTSLFTAAATDAFMIVQQYAPSFAPGERVGGTYLCTMRLTARLTYVRDKLSLQPSAGPYMNTAFPDGVIFSIHCGANPHTRKTPDTLV